MKFTEKMSNKLNELLEKNYDAEKGYKKAAENVENTKLKQFFNEQAPKRYDFGHEIKNEIKNYGETPEKGGSATGAMHRTWMDIETAFSSNNEETILEEVQKGEKAAIEEYNEVIQDTTLPPTTQKILTNQRDAIQNACQSAKNFEAVVS
ncbi:MULTISPECIES: ferritin-like domain-containing protein [Aequorivita]|uniref:PA2169 family four-helix-bundle protein n=1 Tax=Aequorivita iocasae TaxID=2803865 RepID=A0ABX7DU21_9FLAO|nr:MULTISPECIES: PA2169 family four-helix-bundle protein [Aequorivita]QQX77307.1 PA2169 family four-helix-bundle protein [Aequorivita iocasae]UCA56796.1 PA2169 family four-helix-bundle protein [Aequorivita sp. F7]